MADDSLSVNPVENLGLSSNDWRRKVAASKQPDQRREVILQHYTVIDPSSIALDTLDLRPGVQTIVLGTAQFSGLKHTLAATARLIDDPEYIETMARLGYTRKWTDRFLALVKGG